MVRPVRGDGMTPEFAYMLKFRLPNWGRWGRQDSDRPDPEAGSGSIYQMGRADRTGEDDTPELPPAPINHADAEKLNDLIGTDDPRSGCPGRIAQKHRRVIRAFFYKRNEPYGLKVDAAVRALLDAVDEAEKKVIRWVA